MDVNQIFTRLLELYLTDAISFKEKIEFFELVATGDFDDILKNAFEMDVKHPGIDQSNKSISTSDEKIIKTILSDS